MSRDPEPLSLMPNRPAAVLRVTVGLVLLGFFDLVLGLGTLISGLSENATVSLNLPLACLALWMLAFFVWRNSRVIWSLLAYGSAIALGGMIGTSVGGALGLPPKLLAVAFRAHPDYVLWSAAYFTLWIVCLIWLFWEAQHVRGVAAPSPNRWLKPSAFLAYPIALNAVLVWGVLNLLQGGWTEPVLKRARAEYGAGYDYVATHYRMESRNGRTSHHAVVLAYSDTEIRQIPLAWSDSD